MHNVKKILVFDDDLSILDAIGLILGDAGYDTLLTPDYKQIPQMIAGFSPDLIILDCLLSGGDGRLIAKQLKGDQKTKHIPIIMISAHPSVVNHIEENGINAFLPKPFEAKSLLHSISSNMS